MQYEVEQYQLAYHPQKGAQYRIKVRGGQWSRWITVSAAELAVVAALLNETPVFYNTQTGYLYTGEEPTGE